MKPLNNNCLIRITKEYEGVARTDANESMKRGVLVDFSVSEYHLTASAGLQIAPEVLSDIVSRLSAIKEKTVRWEEYAEAGQTFEDGGETFTLIPWWRLIGVEDER